MLKSKQNKVSQSKAPPQSGLKILVADDHDLIRKGVSHTLINKFPDAQIYFASDFEEVYSKIKNTAFDLLITDLNMGPKNILTCVTKVVKLDAELKILVYSMSPSEHLALRLIRLGAKGYVNKGSSIDVLSKAIDEVVLGNVFGERSLIRIVLDDNENLLDRLNDREFEMFLLFANGCTTKEVADFFFLHPSSISNYKTKIFKKLELRNVVELTLLAVEQGLIL